MHGTAQLETEWKRGAPFEEPADEELAESASPDRLALRDYIAIARRRLWYFVLPVLVLGAAGAAVVMALPALYLSEGKILVETQRIPTELVRSTVTTRANERIQLIAQRLLTRDNITSVLEKTKLFPDRRSTLSSTELVDLTRERTQLTPIELGTQAAPDQVSLAFTISFLHEDPEMAARVAGELITLILNEDLRNRASRASETTRFLDREVRRLQAELAALTQQIEEATRKARESARSGNNDVRQAALERRQAFVEKTNAELGALKTERVTKANRLSWNHPEVQSLQRRIASLERAVTDLPPLPSFDAETENTGSLLQKQQANLQERLNEASAKLAAAQLGEALERDQHGARLEVIEQPTRPQRPTKPNRRKLLALVGFLAISAGAALAFLTEKFDTTVRRRADLLGFVNGGLVVSMPLVRNSRDRRRARMKWFAGGAAAVLVGGAVALFWPVYLPPPDVLWSEALVQIPRYLTR